MQNLTKKAHDICLPVLQSGDIAIDATAGNGHDTLFLARQVGPQGTVYSFDIQKSAIENTCLLLEQAEVNNVILREEDHASMQKFIPEKHRDHVAVVMFNLGYLPKGDKSLTTCPSSTISAIEQSLDFLRPDGLMTVLAYTGHPGGQEEADAVSHFLENLCDNHFTVTLLAKQEGHISPPQLFVVRKLIK